MLLTCVKRNEPDADWLTAFYWSRKGGLEASTAFLLYKSKKKGRVATGKDFWIFASKYKSCDGGGLFFITGIICWR